MAGKINRDYLKSYAATYTNQVLEQAFKDREYLTGNDLMELGAHKQVSYNLLKNIFLQWEAEIGKLESPYFDYTDPAVQAALKAFMDVLSQHIRLDKGSIRPVLQQSVEETMYQVYHPISYFGKFLWPDHIKTMELSELTKLKRFIKVNGEFFQKVLQSWDSKQKISYDEYQDRINQLQSEWDEKWDAVDGYSAEFSSIAPLQLDSLESKEVAATPNGSPQKKSVNDQFTKKVVSLNDKLQKVQTTLADQHQQKKVENLKESLTLNQKFMFVNELYAGNSEEFSKVMEKIDQCKSYNEALGVLERDSSNRTSWDMESEAVRELLEMVSRRF